MAVLRMEWLPTSKAQFEDLRQRAILAGVYEQFQQLHNEIVLTLKDFEKAVEKGERTYNTRKTGGEVRHWVLRVISVTYAVFHEERVGWILDYRVTPASWPETPIP